MVKTKGFSLAWSVCGIISACLLVYTSLRAYRLPFVHDEGVTYLLFILPGVSSLMDCYDANNHFLNTLLMFCCSKLFGNSEIALRLPNLVAHIIFMFTAFSFVRTRFSNPVLVVSAFLILNVNLFVLDFFSLARGYGIALALMLLCAHFLMIGIRLGDGGKKYVLASFWCAGLAAFANLSFLNLLAGILGAYLLADSMTVMRVNSGSCFLIILRKTLERAGFFYKHIVLMLLVLLPLCFNLYKENALYYGGQSGLWRDMVVSLIESSGYGCIYLPVYLVVGKVLVISVVSLFVILFLWYLKRKTDENIPDALFMFTALVFMVTIALVQHIAFGTPYPRDRTALYFLLFFEVISVLLLGCLADSGKSAVRALAVALLVLWASGSVFHAMRNGNINHSFIWKYAADVKQAIADIGTDVKARRTVGKIKFGINWTFEPSLNYYYAVKKPFWMPIVTREGIKGGYDYYYVRPEDRPDLVAENVEILREYPATGNILARARARQ